MKWHADSLKYIKLYTEKELKEFWINNKSCCSLLSGLSVWMWMCVYIHYILTCLIEHVNACECMVAKLCVCMWRKEVNVRCPSSNKVHIGLWDRISHWDLKLTNKIRMVAWRASGILLSASSVQGLWPL